MTEGKPLKLIIAFAIPVLLGSVIQQFYNLADTMIVGQKLGNDALAAVGSTGAVVNLLFNFIFGFTNGFTIIISQYFGGKDLKNMRKSIAHSIILISIVTILVSTIPAIFMRDILRIMDTPEEILEAARSYIIVLTLGLPCTALYNATGAFLKSVGNSVIPLVFLGISCFLNVGMDFLFIFGFGWGIPGAAYSTVIAQGISGLLCLLYIAFKAKILHITFADFTFDMNIFGKLLTTGFSMACMLCVVSAGTVVLQKGINSLGKETIAAHTAGRKILEVVMNPFSAIGAATSTFTSQNYGAGLYDRIKKGTKDGLIISFIWSTIVVIIAYTIGKPLVGLIAKEGNTYIIETGAMYLRIAAPFFYTLALLVVLRNILQGVGQRITPIIASIVELFGKVLVVFVLVPKIQYLGICFAEPIIWFVDGIFVLIVFLIWIKKAGNRKSVEVSTDY